MRHLFLPKHSYSIFTFLFLIFSSSMSVFGNSENCQNLRNSRQVVDCAIQNNPDLNVARKRIMQSKAYREFSSQRPNPIVMGNSIHSQSNNQTIVNFRHVFELGGKWSARVRLADSQIELQLKNFSILERNTILSTVLSLYRLQQIEEENNLLSTAKHTLSGLIGRLKRFPILNAEQEVALETYEVSLRQLEQMQGQLERERKVVLGQIQTLTQIEPENPEHIIPKPIRTWSLPGLGDGKSPELLLAESQVENANAQKGVAESLAWPNLQLGPAIGIISQSSSNPIFGKSTQNATDVGLSFYFQVPILNQNEGGIKTAKGALEAAAENAKAVQFKNKIQKNVLLNNYKNSVENLKKIPAYNDLVQKERKMKRRALNGLLSPALVIQFFNSSISFLQIYHQTEMAAHSAKWNLYSLYGKISSPEALHELD